jgi:hypothetical protein
LFDLWIKANLENNPFLKWVVIDSLTDELQRYIEKDDYELIINNLKELDMELKSIKDRDPNTDKYIMPKLMHWKFKECYRILRKAFSKSGMEMKERDNDDIDDF